MVSKVKEFVSEQAQSLNKQARALGKAPGKMVRGAAAKSAKRIRALQEPVRVATDSGVKLGNLSHDALLKLLALQLDVVTGALADAASQLERLSQTDNVRDLLRAQVDELRATRERIVADVNRAIAIAKDAGRGVKAVATDSYARVTKPAPARKPARRKSKSTARRARKR
jgi:hypothetical protein